MAEPKSHWNYRVMAYETESGSYFVIHEVYYKDGVPTSHTKYGATIGDENINTIPEILDLMKACLEKPVLSVKEFPREYKPQTGTTQ